MNRRNFLKAGSLAIGAAAVANIAGASISKLFASTSNTGFSIELVTDNEDKAIKLVQDYISGMNFGGGTVNFSEYSSDKPESGDIVLVKSGKLINYKTGSSDQSRGIKEIADSLKLPRIIQNPVRLKFSVNDNETTADNFLIFHRETLIRKVNINSGNRNIHVTGSKGEMTINVSSKKARVVSASCTHKNCVNSGSISLKGENIVCIPNEVHIIAD